MVSLKHKIITLPHLDLLAVEIPNGINEITITDKRLSIPDRKGSHIFFDGDWKHLGAVGNLSEEQAVQIVEKIEYPWLEGEYCYPDYVVYGKSGFKAFDTALESLHSLLESNGWEGETSRTHLFIKQNKAICTKKFLKI